MAKEGGLWIEIGGAVQQKLLRSLEKLQEELRELAITARTTLNAQFGAGLDQFADRLQNVRDETESTLNSLAKSQQKHASSAEESASRAAEASKRELAVLKELKDERDELTKAQAEEIDTFSKNYEKIVGKYTKIPTETEALKSYQTDLRKLGSQLERLQNQMSEDVGEDIFETFRQEISRAQDEVNRKMLPSIWSIQEELGRLQIGDEILTESEINDIKRRIRTVKEEVGRLKQIGQITREDADTYFRQAEGLEKQYKDRISTTIDDIEEEYNRLKKFEPIDLDFYDEIDLEQTKKTIDGLINNLNRLKRNGEISQEVFNKWNRNLSEFRVSVKKSWDELRNMPDLVELNKQIKRLQDWEFEGTVEDFTKFKKVLDDIKDKQKKLPIDQWNEYEQAIDDVNYKYRYHTELAEDALKQYEKQKKLQKDTAESYQYADVAAQEYWKTLKQKIAQGYIEADAAAEEYWKGLKRNVAQSYMEADAAAQEYWKTLKQRVAQGYIEADAAATEHWKNVKKNVAESYQYADAAAQEYWKTLKQKVAQGYIEADAAAEEYWNYWKKRISDSYQYADAAAEEYWKEYKKRLAEGYQYADAEARAYWAAWKKQVAESYKYADAEAQAYWNDLRKQYETAQKDLADLQITPVGEMSEQRLTQFQKDVTEVESRLKSLRKLGLIDPEQFEAKRNEIADLNASIKEQREVLNKNRSDVKKYEARMEKAKETLTSVQSEIERLNQLSSETYDFELVDPDDFRSIQSRISRLDSYIKKFHDDFEELDEVNVDNLKENVSQLERSLGEASRSQKLQKSITNLEESFDRLGKQQETLDIFDPQSVESYNKELGFARRKLEALRGAIPDESFENLESRLFSAKSVLQDTESHLNKLKSQIDDINKTPFNAIPEGQLPERLKQIRRLNSQLYQLYQNGEITNEEWKEQSNILHVNDRRLSNLLATTEEYNRTGHRTAGVLTRLNRAFSRASRMIIQQVQLWGILGGILVGIQAAYAALATWATKAAASLGENAEKLNMSTQALSEFQRAAIVTGTSVRDLNEALSSLSDSVMDAVKGKDKAVNAFNELGIEFDTLIKHGNDTEKMFQLVMERLGELSSSAKKLSLAKDIFGKGPASTLINLTGNLEEARNAMKQFDITMSEEGVQAAEMFWNKLRGLWLVIKRQFISASIEAIDTMSRFADQLLNTAAKGNIFEGTIVPAVKSTVGILKSLITAARGVYSAIHAMYEAWDYLLVPIKAFMGYLLVSYFDKLTKGIQSYVAAMKTATTTTQAFNTALKGILRFTGYFLLIEGIFKLIDYLGKAQKVAKETELTFEEAFKAIVQQGINNLLEGLAKAIPAMFSIGAELGWSFTKGFIKSVYEHLSLPFILYNLVQDAKKRFTSSGKEAGKNFAMGFQSVDDDVMKTLKEYQKQGENTFDKMNQDWFEEYDKSSPLAERLELIKSAAEETSKDVVSSIEKMAKEGRVEDVENMIPFAKKTVQKEIENTEEKLKAVKETIEDAKKKQAGPWEVIQIPEEDFRLAEKLKIKIDKLYDKLKKVKDLDIKSGMNKFMEKSKAAMDEVRSKYDEGTKELLKAEDEVLEKRVKKLQKFKEKATDEQVKAFINEELQEAKADSKEKDEERVEENIERARTEADRIIAEKQRQIEEEKALLDKKVTTGEMEDYEAERQKAELEISGIKEKIQVQEEFIQKIDDEKGKSEELRKAKEKLKGLENELKVARIERATTNIEATRNAIQAERDLAEARKNAATAGLPEEEQRYKLVEGNLKRIEQSVLDSIQTRLEAEKNYRKTTLDLYEKELDTYEKGSDDYKQLELEKQQFAEESQRKIYQLQEKYARKRIKKEDDVWEQAKLGINNFKDEFKSTGEYVVELAETIGSTMQDSFSSAFADFIIGTKTATEAFNSFANSMLQSITKVMTNYLTQKMMQGLIGGKSSGSGLAGLIGQGLNFASAFFGGGGGSSTPPGSSSGSTVSSDFMITAHSGGIIGKNAGDELRKLNSSVIDNAPRLHNGLKSNEVPAILEKGEKVIPKDKVGKEENSEQQQTQIVNNIKVEAPEGKISKESMTQLQRKMARSMQNAMRQ